MARDAKVHKSIRFDYALFERVESLRLPDENFTEAINRILEAGVCALDSARNQDTSGIYTNTGAYAKTQYEVQAEHDEQTEKIIAMLEKENARLIAEHEADRAALAEKDALIAEALHKAHELTENSQVLVGISHEAKRIEAGGEVVEIVPNDRPLTFIEKIKSFFS